MQRKKRRSTLTGLLHSIPIYSNRSLSLINHNGDKHNKLSHVSNCSIPLVCMALLLLGGVAAINPSLFNGKSSYAIEVGQGANDNSTDSEAGIAPQSIASPSINMTVAPGTDGFGGTNTQQVTTAPGASTAYRSHNIEITGHNITHYQLTISGNNLASTGAGATTIGGADGATGAAMPVNTWGYGWDDQSKPVEEIEYKTMSATAQDLVNEDVPRGDGDDNGYDIALKKKLVFGANFGAGASSGIYTADVTISLTSTPLTLSQTWMRPASVTSDQYTTTNIESGIDTMQAVDATWAQQYCSGTGANGVSPKGIKVGDVLDLKDSRDDQVYRIVKLEDGNCWMQQNLRLKGATNLVDPQKQGYLTPEDSDVTARWQLPATLNGSGTSISGWTNDYNKPYSAYFSNTTNGVYYNWTAAIAMSDSSSKTSGDVNTSICPRGWKLPTNSEYSNMLTSEGIANSSAGSTKIRGTPYNYVYAGRVNGGTLGNAGSSGYYWSRTAGSADGAYSLYFDSSNVYMNNSYRDRGFSVRCVTAGASWKNESGKEVEKTDLKTIQQVTKENFSDKYCANTTAANALVPAGSTITLRDSRDGNNYKIMKMNDGKCWMVENLRLPGGTSLDSTNSDVTSAYTLPANQAVGNTINNWGTDKTSQNMAEGSTGMKINGSGAWKPAYGNYYSWCTATAGTCSDSGDAPSSICPKGWTLPSNSNTNIGTYTALNSAFAGSWTAIGGVNGIKLGYNSNDAFFPAAGLVNGDGLYNSGSYGYYWSSTVYSSNVSRAYDLFFNSGGVSPAHFSNRYLGFSVRCVASF